MQEGVHCGFKTYPENLDWWLITAVLILMGCGLGLIDSATHSFAVSTGKAGMCSAKVCLWSLAWLLLLYRWLLITVFSKIMPPSCI